MFRDIKFRIAYTAQDGSKTIQYDDDKEGLRRYMVRFDGTVLENYGWPKEEIWEIPFDVAELPILHQLTGAKDKNDKDIYEGDIVKCKRFYLKQMVEGPKGTFHSQPDDLIETGEEIGIVFFSSVTLGWCIEYRRYDDFDDLSHFCAPHRIEVVGNVHQNADMLKNFQNSSW